MTTSRFNLAKGLFSHRANQVSKDLFAYHVKTMFPDAIAEYRFDQKRKWRFDWYLPQQSLAIEIEGGIWIMGRHTRPAGFLKDVEKYNAAALKGILLYRVPHTDLRSETKILYHLNAIKKVVKSSKSDYLPNCRHQKLDRRSKKSLSTQ